MKVIGRLRLIWRWKDIMVEEWMVVRDINDEDNKYKRIK